MTEEIINARTGQRMRFLRASHGEDVLRIESVNPPTGIAEPTHVHPNQETRIEVLQGELVHTIADSERRLGPGDTLTIPSGVPHGFRNVGEIDAVSIQEFRPALNSEKFFRTLFGLAAAGEINDAGMPSLLRLSVLAPVYGDEIRVVRPPWPVQRAVFAVLSPLARLRGLTS
jgi:quercetin dioxygenase-like cupin family protein